MKQFTKEDILKEITENYNMGFLSEKEYFCQKADTLYSHFIWKIFCIIPSFVYRIYVKLF